MGKNRAVGERVLRNYNFLKNICKKKKCQKYLNEASIDELTTIVEICLNILKSKFPLTSKEKERLRPYANFVRCNISSSFGKKGAQNYTKWKWNTICAIIDSNTCRGCTCFI